MPLSTPSITVVIADDHPLFRQGLRQALLSHTPIQVLGEAASGRELCLLVDKLRPHVVITDLSMPEMNGLEALRLIRRHTPATGVVVMSMHEEAAPIKEALQAGAHAYLSKTAPFAEVMQAVQSAARGKVYFSPTTTGLLGSFLPHLLLHEPLSERETQILSLLYQECTTREISAQINLSERTIEDHRKHLLQKTGSKNAIGIIKYALKHKLLKLE